MITIYCHTNRANGKRYVGQTVDSMEQRWTEHVYAAKHGRGCPILGAAIRKYGAETFAHEVLETVASLIDADRAEAKWITELKTRSPDGYNLALGGGGPGYHHEDSKRLIAESSRERLRAMSPEQRAAYFRTNIHIWTDERRSAHIDLVKSEEMREKIADGQKDFWSQFSSEEKSVRVRHQLAGLSAEQKSERVRKAWANMTPEARAARVRKTRAANVGADVIRSVKMSAWQTAQAKLRTPEQRRAMAKKASETMRARGIRRGPAPIAIAPEVLEEAGTMRAAGMSITEIAVRLRVSKSALWKCLSKLTPEQRREGALKAWETRREKKAA